jgi:hypothetical protein
MMGDPLKPPCRCSCTNAYRARHMGSWFEAALWWLSVVGAIASVVGLSWVIYIRAERRTVRKQYSERPPPPLDMGRARDAEQPPNVRDQDSTLSAEFRSEVNEPALIEKLPAPAGARNPFESGVTGSVRGPPRADRCETCCATSK